MAIKESELQQRIDNEKELRKAIADELNIHVRVVEKKSLLNSIVNNIRYAESGIESSDLSELGRKRRELTLEVTRLCLYYEADDNTDASQFDVMYRLKGLFRSIEYPKTYTIETKVEGIDKHCCVTDCQHGVVTFKWMMIAYV
ncbi:uncharacterized protein LOC126841373 [Adelges cooleyi]|uniref:uncharacterized protein LOC126841373 n=1 Tax=Adelges cooleyi TaxID=133065 RepID=UPI00217FD78E|nr:uncharacterized protein LOC126841373 [Adelges cooleyi]